MTNSKSANLRRLILSYDDYTETTTYEIDVCCDCTPDATYRMDWYTNCPNCGLDFADCEEAANYLNMWDMDEATVTGEDVSRCMTEQVVVEAVKLEKLCLPPFWSKDFPPDVMAEARPFLERLPPMAFLGVGYLPGQCGPWLRMGDGTVFACLRSRDENGAMNGPIFAAVMFDRVSTQPVVIGGAARRKIS